MQCPRCHLENPPSTTTCDCGYSFATGAYVPKSVDRPGEHSMGGQARPRYAALESISTFYRIAAWVILVVLVLVGVNILANSTDQTMSIALYKALACFVGAAVQWLVLKAVAEAINLFVDIACDVRAMASKMNNNDGR